MNKRKIVAFIIILFGLTSSFLIVKNAKNSTNNTEKTAFLKKNSNANLNFKASAPDFFQGNSQGSGIQSPNLTEILAKNYSLEIIKENAGGPQVINGKKAVKAVSPDLLPQILETGLSQKLDYPQFETKDLKISYDNSKEAQLVYLTSFAATFRKNFGGFNDSEEKILNDFILNKNSAPLEKYLSLIPSQINSLLATPVPSLWKEFHLENLNLWQKKLAAFKAVADLENDPVKTFLAFNELENIKSEVASLQKVVEEKFNELISSS